MTDTKRDSTLHKARFFTSAASFGDLPKTNVPEIAFVGRSNAGKSSAINVLCNQNKLAFASKTPGRTQHINFYSVGGGHPGQHRKDAIDSSKIEFFLVDLPGYGFAEVSGSVKTHWRSFLSDYIAKRDQLKALVLVTDSRRPLQEIDCQMIEWFAQTGKPIHCLLTKADKLNRSEANKAISLAKTILASYGDETGKPLPYTAALFSATKRTGLAEATKQILSYTLADPTSETE